jgi:hypothetical protein
LLIVLTSFFAFIEKTAWIKRGIMFISLIVVALLANIIRLLWACGMALNYGTLSADKSLHGALLGFVFIFIVSAAIFLEFLFSSD